MPDLNSNIILQEDINFKFNKKYRNNNYKLSVKEWVEKTKAIKLKTTVNLIILIFYHFLLGSREHSSDF